MIIIPVSKPYFDCLLKSSEFYVIWIWRPLNPLVNLADLFWNLKVTVAHL